MSQGHHHRHNSSLRRALLAQAGPQAYPYMRYSPTAFTPRQIGYDGVFNQGYGHTSSDGRAHTHPFKEDIVIHVPKPKPKPQGYRVLRGARGGSRSFNGYGAPYGGWFGKAMKGIGGVFKEVLPAVAEIGGGILGTKMEGQTLENIAQANADAATEQARINAEANTKMAEMQFKFGGTSVGIWTIVGIVGGVAVLGGLTFFVLRKRKK